MKRQLKEKIKDNFTDSPLWLSKLKDDCKAQKVFLAIRDNKIGLYHRGGKLFEFSKDEFKTNIKFASVKDKLGNDYLSENEIKILGYEARFIENYQRINENCEKYSGPEDEGISKIYHKHSYLAEENKVVLDIEVSFESLNHKGQDRIDVLLFDKEKQELQFVEVKHYSNGELWSSTGEPKVIKQVKRYETQIKNRNDEILSTYTNYIEILNKLFDINLPIPKSIHKKVTLLIFGFDSDQLKGRLNKLIIKNNEFNESGISVYAKGDIGSIVLNNID